MFLSANRFARIAMIRVANRRVIDVFFYWPTQTLARRWGAEDKGRGRGEEVLAAGRRGQRGGEELEGKSWIGNHTKSQCGGRFGRVEEQVASTEH